MTRISSYLEDTSLQIFFVKTSLLAGSFPFLIVSGFLNNCGQRQCTLRLWDGVRDGLGDLSLVEGLWGNDVVPFLTEHGVSELTLGRSLSTLCNQERQTLVLTDGFIQRIPQFAPLLDVSGSSVEVGKNRTS